MTASSHGVSEGPVSQGTALVPRPLRPAAESINIHFEKHFQHQQFAPVLDFAVAAVNDVWVGRICIAKAEALQQECK